MGCGGSKQAKADKLAEQKTEKDTAHTVLSEPMAEETKEEPKAESQVQEAAATAAETVASAVQSLVEGSSEPGSLKVKIAGAKGLRAADLGAGTSDPYVMLKIKGNNGSACKTKVVSKSLSPVFDEEFAFNDYKPGDELEIKVMDQDTLTSDDHLGCVTLTDEQLKLGVSGELKLEDTKGAESFVIVSIEGAGGVVAQIGAAAGGAAAMLQSVAGAVASAAQVPDDGTQVQLKVTIKKAVALRSADFMGKSDPFVVISIPGKTASEVETRVVPNTLDPVWDETTEVPGYQMGDELCVKVMDKDCVGAALLGQCTLAADVIMGGFDGEVKLQDTKCNESFLHLKVEATGGVGAQFSVAVEDFVDGSKVGPKPRWFGIACC